ncbi:MAG: GGDEF domain-containing protein [Pseudomonadales bacterium]|nr:GGDEF domain-containing protein [Pseudomonadales bacterium]
MFSILRNPHNQWLLFYNWAINIGTKSLQSPNRERAVSTNQFILLALALTLSFQLYYLLFDFTNMLPVILVHATSTGIYIFALYLNSKGRVLLAACIALAGPLFFQVPAICYLISADSGMHFFLLAGSIFTFLVFSDDHKHFRLGFIIVSLIFFVVIERYFTRELAIIKLSDGLLDSMVYLNAIGTSVMIYLLSSLSHSMVTEQGDKIRVQAKALDMLANTDPLTQLPNRRQILSATEVRGNGKSSFTGVIAVADIDRFKSFNDRYGHDCGDEILRSLAHSMSSSMRSGDTVGRWGGEEFIFLLSGVNMNEAKSILERLRLLIEKTSITHSGTEHYITVSIGAAEMRDGKRFEAAFKMADQALYQCKQNGRNCVISS